MSPTVFRWKEYRFFFFSREESRCHVHVMGQQGQAKFWLEPEVALAKNHGLSQTQLAELQKIVTEHQKDIVHAWSEHFKT
jgi:hypothetical protein